MKDDEPVGQAATKRGGRGCLFWGCLGTTIIVLATGVGIAWWVHSLLGFTSTESVAIPVHEVRPGEVEALRERFDAFEKAPAGSKDDRIEVRADDLNALLASTEEGRRWAKRVHVRIEGDRILADVSIPLAELRPLGIEVLAGRYLNGTVELGLTAVNRVLDLRVMGATANGKPLPSSYLALLGEQNLLEVAKERLPPSFRDVGKVDVQGGKIFVGK
jgi:hypothetical protein